MPCRPQKLAGTRTEPPVSVPSAVSQRPWATAEAEPEDEPPGTRSGARGLSGVPLNGFSPRMPSETSSVIVLPIRVAPASRSRCTAQACRSGTGCVRPQSGLPPPVGCPATSKRSLAAKVRPASGPSGAPAMCSCEPGTNGLVMARVTRPVQSALAGGAASRALPPLHDLPRDAARRIAPRRAVRVLGDRQIRPRHDERDVVGLAHRGERALLGRLPRPVRPVGGAIPAVREPDDITLVVAG